MRTLFFFVVLLAGCSTGAMSVDDASVDHATSDGAVDSSAGNEGGSDATFDAKDALADAPMDAPAEAGGWDACYAQCKAQHPEGFSAAKLVLYSCACACANTCTSSELCAGMSAVDKPCGQCIQTSGSQTCTQDRAMCMQDVQCKAFLACIGACP